MNIPENIDSHNQEQLDQIVATYTTSTPQKSIIVFDDHTSRDHSLQKLVEAMPDTSHFALDLSETQVDHIANVIEDKLSDIIDAPEPENFFIHVINLETSFLNEVYSGEAAFLPNLIEAPTQLEDVLPANYLIWTDAYTHERIKSEADAFYQSVENTYSIFNPEESSSENPYQQLEALKAQIDSSDKTEAEKAEVLLEVTEIFQKYRKSGLAIEFGQQVIEWTDNDEIESAARAIIGISYANQGGLEDAQEYLEEGIEGLAKIQDHKHRKLLAHAHSTLGQIFTQSHHGDSAMKNFRVAAEFYAAEELFTEAAIAQNQLAIIHEKKGNVEKSVSCYEQTAAYFASANSPKLTARAYQQVGMIRQGRFQWDLSLEAFRKALVEAQKTEDDFLIVSLEDSIEQLEEREAKSSPKKKEDKKKGFLGRLFG